MSLQEEVTRWEEQEDAVLMEKAAKAKEKHDAWGALSEDAIQKKCLKKIKAILMRPSKLASELREKGDDLFEGLHETLSLKLSLKRLNRLRSAYVDSLEKLKNAKGEVSVLLASFPEAVEAVGGIIFNEEITEFKNSGTGTLSIMTLSGVQSANDYIKSDDPIEGTATFE